MSATTGPVTAAELHATQQDIALRGNLVAHRDKLIRRARQEGMQLNEIADALGLSPGRVWQIVNATVRDA